jgi:POT family proton-dependent oligopeptide transporter
VKTEREELNIPGGPDGMDFSTKKEKHPRGLYLLYFTEMWERFSYYGMRAIFTLYMINALLFDKKFASEVYGSYTGLVYLTPLLGGYIADRYWGNRRSIIFGGILMALGQFFMFVSGSMYTNHSTSTMVMYGGLGLLILGNGFFKPNISTMVGSLYKEGDRRVDSAFTIFYQGINLGALIAPLVCGWLGERYDTAGNIIQPAFKWGFLAACIGMIISLIAFIWLKNKYIVTPAGEPIGMPVKKETNDQMDVTKGQSIGKSKIIGAAVAIVALFFGFYTLLDFDFIGSLIFSTVIVLPVLIYVEPSLTRIEKDRILVIYIIAFFVIFFWSAFEQAGASLTFFAQEQTNRNILGWNMPASFFQVFNAMFIVILAPVAVAIWDYLGKKGKEPASPVKQSLGLALLAIGYLYIAYGVKDVAPWTKVSMIWLVGLYFIHTVGELCLSPIGLSMVVKLSPVRFTSLLMGVWFMSTATANKFAGTLSALYPEEVKLEKSYDASPQALATLQQNPLDTAALWKLSAKETVPVKTAAVDKTKDGNKDSVISAYNLAGNTAPVSVYHMKLIRVVNNKVNFALASPDGKFVYTYRKEAQKTKDGDKVTEKVDVWNTNPERPKFLGMTIRNLHDFFMIFVYMAGAAAIVLFAIHKWLLRKMHGVK